MKVQVLKGVLVAASGGCDVQHDGWPCGTCFFNISEELINQDWQAVLYFRDERSNKDSFDNLPDDLDASLQKTYDLCIERLNEIRDNRKERR